MMRKFPKKTKGVTAVELMVSLGLLVLLSSSLILIFRAGIKSTRKGTNKLVLLQTVRTTFAFLNQEIREASENLTISGANTILTFEKPFYNSRGFPEIDPSTGMFKKTQVTLKFDLSSGILYKNGRKIIEGINNLKFGIITHLIGGRSIHVIKVELAVKLEENKIENFREIIVPRWVSFWAKDPHWVGNHTKMVMLYK